VFFGAVASISVDANNGDDTTPRAMHLKSRGERSTTASPQPANMGNLLFNLGVSADSILPRASQDRS
jgi:hypothetical protein